MSMERLRLSKKESRKPRQIPWKEGQWVSSFPDESLGMSMQDVSPGFAIRKIIMLFENHKYEHCAILINRLSHVTLKTIIPELPMDILIDAIPQSLIILECVYSKLFIQDSENFPVEHVHPHLVVHSLVRLLGKTEDPSTIWQINHEQIQPLCKNLLRIIAYIDPKLTRTLQKQKYALIISLEGLARHGLVDTSEQNLINLHDALKIEFDKMVHQYRNALQRLEELCLANRSPRSSSVNEGPAPTSASHQRLMQMRETEIQDRIIKNKLLLNVVEPASTNTYLAGLLKELEERIEADKDALYNFTELRKQATSIPQKSVIATVFQEYILGYSRALDIIKEFSTTDPEEYNIEVNEMNCFPRERSSSTTSGKLCPFRAYFLVFLQNVSVRFAVYFASCLFHLCACDNIFSISDYS